MTDRSAGIRARLRQEMERKKITQRDLAGMLKWSQSRIAKILTGRVGLLVDDVEALCFALDLHLTEVMRDHGLEFCAEMTPSELRMLERLRQLDEKTLAAIATIVQMNLTTRNETRGITKTKVGMIHKGRD